MRRPGRHEHLSPLAGFSLLSRCFDRISRRLNGCLLFGCLLGGLEDVDGKSVEELVGNYEGRLARLAWYKSDVFRPDNLQVV